MVTESKKADVSDQIQENLQRVYQEALQDEVPSEFIELIERLKAEKKNSRHDK